MRSDAGPDTERVSYKRPVLEDFIEETIPPVNYLDTEFFFKRVTSDVLGFIRPEYGPVVLDVAAGMGIDSSILSGRGFKVISLEPMRSLVQYSLFHHAEKGNYSSHLRGYAEEIPLKDRSVDQVLCKGSLDHFLDPRASLMEMRRVLKPGGRLVAAVANYDSLSCYLSKFACWVNEKRYGTPQDGEGRAHHEIPSDHVTRFNVKVARQLVGEFYKIVRVVGVGLLWGTPKLNLMWERAPRNVAEKFLEVIYSIARPFPQMADMTVLECVKA